MAVFRRAGRPNYYGYLRLAGGRRRRVALLPVARGERASEDMLRDEQRLLDSAGEGVGAANVGPADLAVGPQLDDYEAHLRAKGDTEKHVAYAASSLREMARGCAWHTLADVGPDALERWLAEGQGLGWSARTRNYYLGVAKAFCRWLVERRRLPANPLDCLRRVSQAVDRRRVRRALSPDDFARLLEAAWRSPLRFRGLDGRGRWHVYNLAAYTGYRSAELASLRTESFRLDDDPPTVTVQAAHSRKRKELARQVLHPDLAEVFRAYLAGRPAGSKAFPGSWNNRSAEMLRLDLEGAGIPYADELGRTFDFHGLRGQFVTTLARAGVHPRTAQKLARHSSVELTMQAYTHLDDRETADTVARLPAPPRPPQGG